MISPVKHPCPACPHSLRAHRVLFPRTLYCMDCDCGMRARWTYAPFVMLLWLGDTLDGWGRSG